MGSSKVDRSISKLSNNDDVTSKLSPNHTGLRRDQISWPPFIASMMPRTTDILLKPDTKNAKKKRFRVRKRTKYQRAFHCPRLAPPTDYHVPMTTAQLATDGMNHNKSSFHFMDNTALLWLICLSHVSCFIVTNLEPLHSTTTDNEDATIFFDSGKACPRVDWGYISQA